MMPPTSIDGTDITGATIDGTDVTEITVDGDTVFTAGPAIPDSEANQKLRNRWLLDDVNGTVADIVGTQDGTNNGITSVLGNFVGGSAGEGDGNSFIDVGMRDFGSEMANPFAIALTFKVDTPLPNNRQNFFSVIDRDTSFPGIFLLTRMDTDGTLSFFMIDDSTNQRRIATTASFDDNNFHRVVFNKIAGNDFEIHVDGSLENVNLEKSATVSNFRDLNYDMYMFGASSENSAETLVNGIMDDVCVFDDSLTSAEISSYQEPF